MFPGSTVLPDDKKTKLGRSDQRASPSGEIKNWVVLVPNCACVSLQLFTKVQLVSKNLLRFSFMFLTGFTSFIPFLLFAVQITIFFSDHSF